MLMREAKVEGLTAGTMALRMTARPVEVVGEFEEVHPGGHQEGAQGEQGNLTQSLLDALHGKRPLSKSVSRETCRDNPKRKFSRGVLPAAAAIVAENVEKGKENLRKTVEKPEKS